MEINKAESIRSVGSDRSKRSAEDITASYLAARANSTGLGNSGWKLESAVEDLPPEIRIYDENDRRRRPPRKNEGPRIPRTYKKKMYTPGPGAYDLPNSDKKGSLKNAEYTFGGSERSFLKHAVAQSNSPGPKYIPRTTSVFEKPGFSFGRDRKFWAPAHNSPVTVPGPGKYNQNTDRTGHVAFSETSAAPKYGFGTSVARVGAEEGFYKVKYVGPEAEVEMLGVQSPGPIYNTRELDRFKFSVNPSKTLAPKLKMEGESFKRVNTNPAPTDYRPLACRNGGGQFLKDARKSSFPKATQRQRPDLSMTDCPFVSEVHSKVENIVQTGGPAFYDPKVPEKHHLARLDLSHQGSSDRFFDVFEPNRIRETR